MGIGRKDMAVTDRTSGADKTPETAERQAWMGVLARALPGDVEAEFRALDRVPDYEFLRPPETGLVMLRGRAAGTGDPFNFGEMTVTRCVVQTRTGSIGHAYVAGRAVRHAELAAVFDALFQDPKHGPVLRAGVQERLAANERRRNAALAAETAPTRVDFYTLVRGEDVE